MKKKKPSKNSVHAARRFVFGYLAKSGVRFEQCPSKKVLVEELAKATGMSVEQLKAAADRWDPPAMHGGSLVKVLLWFYYANRDSADTDKAAPYAARSADRRAAKDQFFSSPAWWALRYEALRLHGAMCQCCGATPKSSGRPLHVDHIKPRSKYPELALELSNLQILCEACNLGKGARDETDWRITVGASTTRQ